MLSKERAKDKEKRVLTRLAVSSNFKETTGESKSDTNKVQRTAIDQKANKQYEGRKRGKREKEKAVSLVRRGIGPPGSSGVSPCMRDRVHCSLFTVQWFLLALWLNLFPCIEPCILHSVVEARHGVYFAISHILKYYFSQP